MGNNSNKLYFQFAIENIRKTLDAQKGEIEKWAKENPILLEVRFKNLKSQLEMLGSLFGKNNSQLVTLGREVEKTFENAKRGYSGTVHDINKMTTATRELTALNEKIAIKSAEYVEILKQEERLNRNILDIQNQIQFRKERISTIQGKRDSTKTYLYDNSNEAKEIRGLEQDIRTRIERLDSLKKQLSSVVDSKVKIEDSLLMYLDGKGKLQVLTQQVTTQQKYNTILADTEKLIERINNAINNGGNRSLLDVAARDVIAFQDKAASLSHYKDEASMVANLTGEYNRLSKVYGAIVKEQEKMIDANEKAAAKTAQSVAIENSARQKSVQTIRSQAEAMVNARRETLNTQATSLGKLLTLGEKGLGVEQFNHVRDALRAIRQELREIDSIMQRGGLSSSVLLSLGGNGRDFSRIIDTAQQYANIRLQAAQAENDVTNAVQRNTTALIGQSHVLSDLRTMAQQYVNIWAVKSFVDNIIEQGGQLEQQRLSIGAILQDAAHANELFGKIKDLAIISPFGVTELDAMTKQLSAYGFKYNELYDMTKRLADISAATGTEVSRLALALGHVRSEGALSGYTLRQFSMGNIPLLEKLSEKIGVTAKEIRKMVSKKEIGYDQFLEVMKELTDEGGMFYNAQETMSQALNAKFKNLRDSFQIMYSEMAEGAPGDFLKGVAETLTTMSKNWRILMPMIAAGAGTFGLWKATTMALNYELAKQELYLGRNAIATSKYSMSQLRAIATTGRWTLALRGLGTALMSLGRFVFNPVTLGFAAVEGLIYLWQKHNQEVEKAKELTSGFKLTATEGQRNLTERMTGIDPYKDGMSESEMKQGIASMTQAIKDYGKGLNVANTLQEAFGSDENTGKVKSLAEQFEFLRGKMEDTLDVYKELERTADAFEFGVNHTDSGWFDDNVITDLDQYSEAFKVLNDSVTEYNANNEDAIKKAVEAAEKADPAFAKATENLVSYSEKLRTFWENPEAYTLGSDAINNMFQGGDESESAKVVENFFGVKRAKEEAMKELDSFMDGVEARLKEKGYKFDNLNKTQVDNLMKQTHDWIDKHPEWKNIIDDIKDKIEVRWPIKLEPDKSDTPKELNDWQKQMQDWLDKHGSKLKIKPDMTRDDIVKLVHQSIKDTQEVVDQTKPILLRFGVDLSNIPEELPIGLRTPWGKKQAKDYTPAANENKTDIEFIKEFGLPSPKEKGGGRKEDKALKAAKTRLDEAKSFLSEYKKYRQTYGKERSISILEELFPTTKGKGQQIVDNYKLLLEQIKNSLKLNTEDRKKFGIDIDKLIADTNLTDAKEKIDRQLKAMEAYISDSVEKYDLYKSLFEKTGNADFSMQAFSNGKMWDDAATSLANILREKMGDKGGVLDWDADKQSSEDWFKKNFDNGEELYKMWEKIVDLIKGNYKNALTNAADAMKNSMTYAERIEAIQANYSEKNKTALTQREIYANQKAQDAEIAKVRLDELKDSINWDAVFGNLQTYTKKALINVRNNLREFIKLNKQSMDVQQLKEVETAIANLDNAIADKSGLFGGLKESIVAYKKATEELTEAEKKYQEVVNTYGKDSIQAQDAKRIVNQAQNNVNNAQSQIDRGKIETEQKLTTVTQSLVTLGKKGGATLSEVGSVVGTLISTIGEETGAIGNLIAAIFSLLDSLGNNPQGFVENLGKSVGNGIYGINSLLNLNNNINKSLDKLDDAVGYDYPVRNFMIGVESLEWMKGPDDNGYEEAKGKYEALIGVWDDLINRKKEYLNESWGTEAANASKEAIKLIQTEIEATKELAKLRLGAGSSTWSHSYGYRMWEGSYSYDGKNWKDVANEISQSLDGVRFEEMSDMLNMSSKQLQWIKENYTGLWSMMDTDFREHLEDIIKYGEDVEDILDKFDEKLHGLTLDKLIESYYNFVTAGEDANDVLAEDLETKLKEAIVKGMIENLYQDRINALISKAGELGKNSTYVDSNGNVRQHQYDSQGNITDASNVASEYTAEEYALIKEMAETLGNEEKNTYEMLKAMYGWSDDDSTSSTGSSIKGITEQTAGLLSAYANSMRADLSVIRETLAQYMPQLVGGAGYSVPSTTSGDSGTDAIYGSGVSEEEIPMLAGIMGVRDYVGAWSVAAQTYYKSMQDSMTASKASLANMEQHTREIMISNDAIREHTAAIEKNTAAYVDLMNGLKNKAWKVPIA